MNQTEKTIITLICVIALLCVIIVGMAASWPQSPPNNVMVYRGWRIYLPDQNSSNPAIYMATKSGCNPIHGVDLPALIEDINEVEP